MNFFSLRNSLNTIGLSPLTIRLCSLRIFFLTKSQKRFQIPEEESVYGGKSGLDRHSHVSGRQTVGNLHQVFTKRVHTYVMLVSTILDFKFLKHPQFALRRSVAYCMICLLVGIYFGMPNLTGIKVVKCMKCLSLWKFCQRPEVRVSGTGIGSVLGGFHHCTSKSYFSSSL